jgi:mRNA interferase RelE/StbE
VAYRVVLTDNAIEDFKALDARWRATVRDALRIHLTHEPKKESKSRIKRLKDLNHPQYRLRIDGIRVFYDVIDEDVVVVAIMSKEKTDEWLEEHGEK